MPGRPIIINYVLLLKFFDPLGNAAAAGIRQKERRSTIFYII